MIDKKGLFIKGIVSVFCHPTKQGYRIWMAETRPFIEKL